MCRLGAMGAGHIPILLAILMVFTLGLTYTISVWRKDVDPWFPYISSTGSRKPESCVFGQLLNFGGFISFVIIYLRYRLVKELNRDADQRLKVMNVGGVFLGLAAAVGMTIVANFQESAVLVVHMVGAFMCFGFGVVYSGLHSVISYRMYPLYNGIRICRIRTLITLLGSLSFVSGTYLVVWVLLCVGSCAPISAVVTGELAGMEWRKDAPVVPVPRPWLPTHAGYQMHVVSAVSEWVLALSFGIFLLSFSRDFEKLRVGVAVEPLVQHLDETPVLSPNGSQEPSLFINT